MNVERIDATKEQVTQSKIAVKAMERTGGTAVVVLGSAANPPHMGHVHCLKVGKEKAEDLGYHVLFMTLAIAPHRYVQKKMERQQEGIKDSNNSSCLVLSDQSRLHMSNLLFSSLSTDNDFSSDALAFKSPSKCYGSALECGRDMRPSSDTKVIVIVGGDRAKMKWRRPPKNIDSQITICCARDKNQLEALHNSFLHDTIQGLVLDDKYYLASGVGPSTSSTVIRSILQGDSDDKISNLMKHGYTREAAKFLCGDEKK